MNVRLLLVASFSLMTWLCKAQSLFTRNYGFGTTCTGMVPADSGNFILGGGMSPMCLIKVKPNGDTLWTKIYSSANTSFFHGESFAAVPDGYILLARSSSDWAVVKTDMDGNPAWTKFINIPIDYFFSKIIASPDSGYIFTFPDTTDIKSIKLDKFGNIQWSYNYQAPNRVFDMIGLANGDIVYACSSPPTLQATIEYDIIRTDQNGIVQNALSFTVSKSPLAVQAEAKLASTSDGGYALSNPDLLARFSMSDSLLSCNQTSTNIFYWGFKSSELRQIDQDKFILTGNGRTEQSGYLSEYCLLNKLSNSRYEITIRLIGEGKAMSAYKDKDGSYLIAGTGYFSNGDQKITLVKADSAGITTCENEEAIYYMDTLNVSFQNLNINTTVMPVNSTPDSAIVTSGLGITNFCAIVGVRELMKETPVPVVFPNPFHEKATFQYELSKSLATMLFVYNVTGNLVKKYALEPGQNQVEISAPEIGPSGMYFYQVITDGLPAGKGKFIIAD